MRVFAVTLAAVTLTGLSSPALAQQAPRGRFVHPADANKDQRLSVAEWRAASEAEFRTVDANGDGYVDGPELVRWKTAGSPGAGAGAANPPIPLAGPPPAVEAAGHLGLVEARERMLALRATLKPGSEEYKDLESSIRDLDEAITSLQQRYTGR